MRWLATLALLLSSFGAVACTAPQGGLLVSPIEEFPLVHFGGFEGTSTNLRREARKLVAHISVSPSGHVLSASLHCGDSSEILNLAILGQLKTWAFPELGFPYYAYTVVNSTAVVLENPVGVGKSSSLAIESHFHFRCAP